MYAEDSGNIVLLQYAAFAYFLRASLCFLRGLENEQYVAF